MKTGKVRNQWKFVDSYTNRIRTYVKKHDVVTVDEIYQNFIDFSASTKKIKDEQKKIRSILHSMFLRGELERLKIGQYKKTSNIF
ncbi:MAG: hypothetical protein EXR16_05685 [Bacteroidetes bacterium]|nr:hypothetical protein [Bacteroidota bacterium]